MVGAGTRYRMFGRKTYSIYGIMSKSSVMQESRVIIYLQTALAWEACVNVCGDSLEKAIFLKTDNAFSNNFLDGPGILAG